MKKKILIASYNLDFGGIETSLINLLKNMDLEKYDVTLVLEEIKGAFLKDVPSDIKIKEYKVSNNKNVLVRKFVNLLKRIKWMLLNYKRYYASICYATYSGPCGFVARTSSRNRILFIHSNYYQAYDKDENKIRAFFDNRKIEKYNHIVFVSNESKKDLCKIYPNIEKKSVTINNLIDYERILKLSEKKVDVKRVAKKIFMFVGRLDESSKRLTLLLEVAKKCKEENVKALFWIVGSGPDEKMYKDIVKNNNLDNVIFYGAKKNPYPYMKACDYLILTSRYEGFPVVYNEAIILEKPVITTIDVSDDYISIPNRFGYVVNEKNIYDKVKELSKTKEKIKETVDYNTLNKKRINLIEQIMEKK
ncbi:MAG: glycosyltransferase [Candidatus Aphodocola sp.]